MQSPNRPPITGGLSSMATEQQLLSRRDTILASLDRAEAFASNFVAERDLAQLPLRISHVDGIWANLESVQMQLEDLATTQEGRALHATVRAEFEPRLFAIKSSLISKLPPPPTSSNTRNPCSGHNNSTLSGIKLPTISLPEFDGDYQQWLTFHDTYVALIHSNTDVPDIQKFHYLRAALKGEAAQLVESISISAANYNLAWDALKSRYSNEYLMKKRHLQALLDVPRMKRESAASLHSLVDDFERHTKILRQLGEPTDAWSTILEHLLCTRLHDDTIKLWEDHASTVTDPNYACLIEFLQRRIRVLESISVNHHTTSGSDPSATSSSSKKPIFNLSSCSCTASTSKRCPACNQPHPLSRCFKFQRLSLSERHQIVNEKRLCLNCLKVDHSVRNCQSEMNCRHCNRRHHTLLHSSSPDAVHRLASDSDSVVSTSAATPMVLSGSPSTGTSEQSLVTAAELEPLVETSVPVQHPRENVFLLTVIVNIVDAFGQEHPARALLDSASQPNLITERLASILRLRRSNVNITVQGAGKLSKPVRQSVYTEIRARNQQFSCGAKLLVMDKVTADLPSQNVPTAGWNIPKELVLADPSFNKSQPIDLVLGAKHFYSFFPSTARLQLAENLPVLVDSVFGWIVAGSSAQIQSDSSADTVTSSSVTISMVSLEESIERFWKSEELVVNDGYSVEERHCEEFFRSTVSRNEEGRYIVRMPRQPDFDVMLGTSKANSLRRFELLEKRLERNAKLKEDYHAFMKEYLDLGHMRLVEADEEEPSLSYYLPHHPVFKDSSTTTKVRVVFDASSKTSTGYSLNEALSVGPVVQEDLLDITIRFRTFKVAVVGDVAKMYRQVLLHPDDRPLVRIFFRFSPHAPVQTYELQTVTYGLAPSSFLATRTLQQLADDEGHAYPLAGPALRKNFYVDDFIGGAQSVEEAIRLRMEMSELLAKGGFELRKWTSNNLEVLKGLTDDQIGTKSSHNFSPNETVKALGICWEPEADILRFDSSIDPSTEPPTKRSILSAISRLFDPLGLIAPVVVRSKILMQELWLLSCGWDDPVPEHVQQKWENIRSELPAISSYRIDRYAFLPNATVQLHIFSDASESAYGACIYARSEDPEGQVRICLLASKSRVAPLKRVSLPRLELSAAVLGAHLYDRVRKAIDIEVSSTFFWSDSAITLQWIRSPPNTWKTYVGNRVSEIQHFTHGCSWNHISGCENPADLVSRGMSVADFIKSKLWRSGPDWLAHHKQDWPTSKVSSVPEANLEERIVTAAVTTAPSVNPWFLRWSSYTRLLHVVAYCQRFVSNCRAKARTQPASRSRPATISLFPDQLERAKTLLTRLAQEDHFADQIRELEQARVIGKRSPLRKLSPFLDPERVLRVGGRLNLSNLPYQAKHPALLPKLHPFTRLIAEHHHKKLLHGGGRTLLSAIREEFWPIDGRRLVRSIVRNCFRCYRLNPIPAQQQIGQLPASRVIPSRPFSVVGVDYAGPLYLKPVHKRAASMKAYVCLFVCFTTKAVYLDLVSELSTSAFLATLRRFISYRGRPSHIHSDNGKNFEGAKNDLVELFAMLSDASQYEKIHSFCASEGITWHLTPPKAPHFGGLWESAIKVAKKHLYRQIGCTRLSYEDLHTLLAQIEAIMNSRPLLPLTEDPNDLATLTPAHFLIGTSMHALPDPDLRSLPTSQLDHYWKLQAHVQRFWVHWQKEYLQELQKDYKGHMRNEDILPGKLVIIIDEKQPATRWPLGRIVELHRGNDNITRVVSLRTTRGIIKRPITKICLLPYTPAFSDEEVSSPTGEATQQIQPTTNPRIPAEEI